LHRRPQSTREQSSPGASSACPSAQNLLAGVYDPDRLTVLNACQRVTGTVESESPTVEQAGDVHFDIAVDPSTAASSAPATSQPSMVG
jgi:hypothetical protein